MKPGRKLKPRNLKILGGRPGKRHVPEEPEYPTGWPEMPSWLDKRGQEVWRYVGEQLERAGVVRLIDRDLLAGYCDAVSRAVTASLKAREDGAWAPRAEKSWATARLFGALFGIGPAERGRVQSDARGKNEKAQFFASA